jgi:hypothetical protein
VHLGARSLPGMEALSGLWLERLGEQALSLAAM